jgi:hypothetical protein
MSSAQHSAMVKKAWKMYIMMKSPTWNFALYSTMTAVLVGTLPWSGIRLQFEPSYIPQPLHGTSVAKYFVLALMTA